MAMAATNELTLTARVRASEDVLFQALQGEAVLLNLKTGTYFGLDAVGTRIWQLLAEHEMLSEVAHVIVAEYDVTQERCASDLLQLVANLEQQGLIAVNSHDAC